MDETIQAAVCGSFDDLSLQHVRFLHAAAQPGRVSILLWSDTLFHQLYGRDPVFPLAERQYLLETLRYVDSVEPVDNLYDIQQLLRLVHQPVCWFNLPEDDLPGLEPLLNELDIPIRVYMPQEYDFSLEENPPLDMELGSKKVLVTGSFDWFHSGHVRFFEECARLGDLYVVVGHDANIRLLKGEGHPMFPQQERLFMVQAVRFVKQAVISTGHGWMDAAPEVERIQPHIYVVNEDGDVPEKREFCRQHGIHYRVLRRAPKPGLPKRQSTELRTRQHRTAKSDPRDRRQP